MTQISATYLSADIDGQLLVTRGKSKKGKQLNGQMKRDKRTNSDLQNNTHKTKD
jgi:hypothetical protein